MANLIRLKQIESGSALQTSAELGADFSQSVIDVVVSNVEAVLPSGVVSSSTQIIIQDTTGQLSGSRVIGDIAATSVNYENIIGLPTLVSGSEQVVGILDSLNEHSASMVQFSTSLDLTYATDTELAISQSNINVDMGEF